MPKPQSRTRRATARKRRAATQQKPAPLDHFHLFPKLPPELQLMVWTMWRQDEPILRHYMSLFHDTRFYAALNPAAKEFVQTSARSAASDQDDPLDPMEYKIRFTNEIRTVQGKTEHPLAVAFRSHMVFNEGGYRHLKPAFAWVNFEKDIFSIENISHRLGGRFRFLMHQIGAKVPKPLAPGHWASRIQTLALHTDCRPVLRQYDMYTHLYPNLHHWDYRSVGDRYGSYLIPAPSLTGIDDQILGIMTSLKRILLVMKGFHLCEKAASLISATEKHTGGYLDYAAIQAAHDVETQGTLIRFGVKCYNDDCPVDIESLKVVGDLRQKLDGTGKRSVELKLVVDLMTV
ncbi:hypothetical protein PG997_013451 [Apiospora hydei]|uniref:2EXR domain-containing protein n=1 Tax=Apiospora hydei TaxID=1337664 RepID=A0ABR1V672_9PEZI